MNIRTYEPGDESAQLKIYNAAAAQFPRFKPATSADIQRRIAAKDFDPGSRLYADIGGNIVGYCNFQANGRIGYPWCLPGQEAAAESLFGQTIDAMKKRGIHKAFSAYRGDWSAVNGFFQSHGFKMAREMVNYVLTQENMPTTSSRIGIAVGNAKVEDLPEIFALDPTVFRVTSAQALTDTIWRNPYFGPESLFVMRDRIGGPIQAAGIFITNAHYADPRAVDSSMPCFRLGAFGTEGMTHKRIKGMFSFVTKPDRNAFAVGMEMLTAATNRLGDEDEINCYAAQVATDAPSLQSFYQRVFEKQGSFPVYERELL